ncbi:MAG: imidazole glycerol phosphate synthase subunit HisH [Planctomycetota bacterium]|nr:imidazole glycerol phosphate synthase subunit HisH [Planctomycetota bacterium]MDW8372861.1 imidazole glycerol phosphate synthase subunit HisH [Planctomycetota bacterium]
MSIGIIDYGMGNVGAIANMLLALGVPAQVLADPQALPQPPPRALILPGVGAFDAGIERLTNSGWAAALREVVVQGRTPLLGICLGMQLMTAGSAEGARAGLGWIAARVTAFRDDPACAGLVVPHMGWRRLSVPQASPLFPDGPDPEGERHRFYFVHSYRIVDPADAEPLAWCTYGRPFVAAWRRGPLWGVQFHPEKSHRCGKQLLRAFARLAARPER